MRWRRRGRGAAEAAIARIEAAVGLDGPGRAVETALARPVQLLGRPAQTVRDALHGKWLGHPLHPILATLPVGTWTLAFGLDLLAAAGLLRDRQANQAADLALKAGAAGAVVAAAAGLADWQYTEGRNRRLGTVHGLTNSAALALTLASLSLRKRGRRGQGRAISALGWACMMAGGYLGGHLVYRRRVGVDQADRSREPRDFVPVLPLAALEEDRPRRVDVHDAVQRREVGVVLVRHRGAVHAMGARCAHQGGPLDQGWVLDGALVCPWHGSRFCLRTAQPMSGPATSPQPRYQTRIRDGQVEIRREQEPGDEVVTAADVPHAVEAGRPETGPKADEVLFEHHQMLRALFRRIAATPREDPARRDLLRTLASELEIHEYVEDHIFYPAVRPVSEDVATAHAEHRQLSDLLAMTLKLSTSSSEFDEHLRALHAAVEHHAGSEERSMFIEAQRLGDARLRELGRALEAMLEDQRVSRFRRGYRDLKIRLLEGV
ncbi:DUF2231 domain-containing protein [Falsiroseomonas sp. E2-1-a20]|uniref:DUF2231 domain-containing protein n=1 Tax=Falsiroseomonas sp. E2-1-a20 TaxID=3239300 RepID=UPI003F367616